MFRSIMPIMPRKTFSVSFIILDIISFVKPFFYFFPIFLFRYPGPQCIAAKYGIVTLWGLCYNPCVR